MYIYILLQLLFISYKGENEILKQSAEHIINDEKIMLICGCDHQNLHVTCKNHDIKFIIHKKNIDITENYYIFTNYNNQPLKNMAIKTEHFIELFENKIYNYVDVYRVCRVDQFHKKHFCILYRWCYVKYFNC